MSDKIKISYGAKETTPVVIGVDITATLSKTRVPPGRDYKRPCIVFHEFLN